jgi:hypothetical protein
LHPVVKETELNQLVRPSNTTVIGT